MGMMMPHPMHMMAQPYGYPVMAGYPPVYPPQQ
jgi:hypothetical protein